MRSTFSVLEHNVSMRVCNVTIDRPAASAGLIAFRSGSVFRFRWRNSARCPAARLVTKVTSGAPTQYRGDLRQDRLAVALQRDGRPRLALPMAPDHYKADAKRFWEAMRTRFEKFALELHGEKTRLPEFGRYAAFRR